MSTLFRCDSERLSSQEIETLLHGEVVPGFEPVRAAFLQNFQERDELGAACAVYYRGQLVVDLWGGYRDYGLRLPWERETMVMCFSSTKGLAALTLAVAHSRGWLDYDETVAHYWPEFAQNGKESITVRQLLAHQAGLVAFDEPLTVGDLVDLPATAAFLARQRPEWEPGTKQGYHSSTLGLYMNALLTRVDPAHRSLGRFFREEIATPLCARFFIGLPDEIPDSLIAHVEVASPLDGAFNVHKLPFGMLLKLISPWSYLVKSFGVPAGFDPNDRATWRVEVPSGNGIGDARAIARIYGEFATGGDALGIGKGTLGELSTPAPPCDDEVLGFPTCYALGFSKPGLDIWFGRDQRAFGTSGAGGSFGFADPTRELGFAYVMTRMDYYPMNDPREKSLRDAVYRCVEAVERTSAPVLQ